ncbi:MAG: hypothetical protein IJZ93_06915 [Clostridia bacterium]|nr:hypothetical protein [Clostridia bacterium]
MKNILKRIVTAFLAILLVFASLPVAVIAEEIGKASGGTSALDDNSAVNDLGYLEINDGYITVKVSAKNGGFHMATVEGDVLTKSDNDSDLIYSDDAFDTSFTSFRVTRGTTTTDYIFGRDYSNTGVSCSEVTVYKSADNAITAEWSVDGIYFKQIIALMGTDTYQHGMAYVSYSYTNTTDTPIDNVEARVMMDTALGKTDYAYYMLAQQDGTYVAIENEKTVSGSDYSNYFFAYDSKTSPNVTAYTLNASVAGESIVPKRVTFAHWADLASTVFDYTPSENNPINFTDVYSSIDHLTADSAVALYYDMNGAQASSQGGTIGLYYGVYSNYNAGDADVALNFTSSGTMFFNEDETGYKDINGALPGNFSTTLKVQNIIDTEIGKLAVAIYPEEQVIPHDGSSFVTDISVQNPYYKVIEGLKPGESRDVRFDFQIDPTFVTGYRKIKIVIYNITNQSEVSFGDDNTVLEEELYVLCPGAQGAEIGFTGMTPEQVFIKGKRFAYITGTNFGLIRDKTQYRIILRPNDGGDDVVLDQDKVVVNPERNTVTLVLDMELSPTTYKVIFDWNDTTVKDLENDALRLIVSEVPQKGDPGYVSSGVYGIVTVERNGTHYDIVHYENEEALKNTKTSVNDIMIVLRGDISVLSTEEKGNYSAEALTLMDGDIININETLDIKNGRVTITKNFDENGKQTEITVDIEGKVYTTKANTKVWDGVLAITSLTEGKLYTLPVYSEQGERSYADGEENADTLTLLWPGAAGGFQTLAGLLISFRYGEFAIMEQGDSYARVISFGASLDPSILVPNGTAGTEAHYSKLETAQREMGISNYTAAQLRATDSQLRKDQMEWRDSQSGTLNLYMDDILFGAGGFIGFNTSIEVGIPAYADGLPYIEGTLSLKVINDYWEFGLEGSADMLVFEMEATLKLKSYNGIPIPDEIYFFIGGTNPGIPVDPFGVFWVRGAGAGISNMYETFFGSQKIPPITLTISGEFAIFSVLSARADVSISPQGIAAYLQNVGVAGITLIDRIGGSVYWYPNFSLSFGVRVDIFDAIIGEGSIIVEETDDGVYFCGYVSATIKIPDKIWIIGGLEIGSAAVGVDNKKIWGSARIIGINFGVTYYWGGSVEVDVGKKYSVPQPRSAKASLRAIPVYTDLATGKTLYMDITNSITTLSSTLDGGLSGTNITSSDDKMLHSFTLSPSTNEDGLLVISYQADNALMAQDYKNSIRINVAGEEYKLEWFDSAYEADHIANIGTNAIFRYDEETKSATVSVSFTDGTLYGKEISVTTPTATDLEILGIARTANLEAVEMNSEMTEVNVSGTGLSLLSKLEIYAKDEEGALYPLGSIDVSTITSDVARAAIKISQNLPTGTYQLMAIGTVTDVNGNEIASPMAETEFTYVNANQPKAPTSAGLSLSGDYTVTLDVISDTNRDGYLTTVYEVTENGYVETVFVETLSELTDEEKAIGTKSILLGGRYSSTDENDITTYVGLEAGKKYVVSVQSYKITEDGSRLLSEAIVSNEVMMVMPTVTQPTFKIDGSVKAKLGKSDSETDTVNTNTVTVKIGGVGEIKEGYYKLGTDEEVAWDGKDITFTALSGGTHTLTVRGRNVTNDSFSALYQFTVDTEAPGLFLTTPQGGGFFSGNSVNIMGITEANARVEISVKGGKTTVIYANDEGVFSGNAALDESLAYQDIRIYAIDAVGNMSMPFGCTLTNSLLGEEDLEPVILYNGKEVDTLVGGADAKQLTMAFKTKAKYVTMNEGSSAAARIEWDCQIIEKSAKISESGVFTSDFGAEGIITATLDNMTAMVSLVTVDLSVADISLELPDGSAVYTGDEQKPAVIINESEALTEGVDYTVAYLNNIDAGTASVVIVATKDGKCIGTRIVEFNIEARSIQDALLSVAQGKEENPPITLTFNGKTLVQDKDYTVSYTVSENGKKGIVTVEGKGNYKGIVSQEYTIDKFDHLTWIIPVAFVVLLGIGAAVIFFLRKKRIAQGLDKDTEKSDKPETKEKSEKQKNKSKLKDKQKKTDNKENTENTEHKEDGSDTNGTQA